MSDMKARITVLGLNVVGVSLLTLSALASPLTPGNLLLYRVGDGSAALTANAAAVFLDEYTTGGTLVQSIALPTTGSSALTAGGTASAEGMMSYSQDGSTIIFTGYRANAGASQPSASSPTTVPRVVATLDPSTGNYNTSVSVTNYFGAIRSATSTDGSSLFYLGGGTGIMYVGSPGTNVGGVTNNTRLTRQVLLRNNGYLYGSNSDGSTANKFNHYGILPTGPATETALVTLTTSAQSVGFALFDLNTSVPGLDTLYFANAADSRIYKYSFDGTTWNANGTLTISSLAQGNIDGVVTGGGVRLFVSANQAGTSTVWTFFDGSGWNSTINGTPQSLFSSPANTAFRGLVYVVPEPGTWTILALGLGALFLIRRRI